MRTPAGPPSLSAFPDPTSNPGPMIPRGVRLEPVYWEEQTGILMLPPIAIICKCRDFNFLFNGAASGSGAASQSTGVSMKDPSFLETPLSSCRWDTTSSWSGLLGISITAFVKQWGAGERERMTRCALVKKENFNPFWLLKFPENRV